MKERRKNRDKLESYLRQLGITTYGMIPVRALTELTDFLMLREQKGLRNEFEAKDISERIHIERYLSNATMVLSMAFPYYEGENEVENGFSVYTKRADYHKVVHSYQEKICTMIQEEGYEAIAFTDSNALPERYLAALAGVGEIGRNQMLITKEYGSYVFLGEIITNYPCEMDEEVPIPTIYSYDACKDCVRCIKACPGQALSMELSDFNRCVSYLTQKKELSEEEIGRLNGRIFGCDVCQMVCPRNQGKQSGLATFCKIKEMEQPTRVYVGCSNDFFKSVLKQTSCGWRGKNVIIRNALCRMAAKGEDISNYSFSSDYLKRYQQQLLQKKKD